MASQVRHLYSRQRSSSSRATASAASKSRDCRFAIPALQQAARPMQLAQLKSQRIGDRLGLRGSVRARGRSRSPVRAGSEQYWPVDAPALFRRRSGLRQRRAACCARPAAFLRLPGAGRKEGSARWPLRREAQAFRRVRRARHKCPIKGGSGRMPGPAAARIRILSKAIRISISPGCPASRSTWCSPRSAKLAASTLANRRKARSPAITQARAATW